MVTIDTESYNEMISALEKFKTSVNEQCSTMTSAGQDCVDNTEGDPAAASAKSKISACVQKIQSSLETIDGIITALKAELEAAEENYRKANQSE